MKYAYSAYLYGSVAVQMCVWINGKQTGKQIDKQRRLNTHTHTRIHKYQCCQLKNFSRKQKHDNNISFYNHTACGYAVKKYKNKNNKDGAKQTCRSSVARAKGQIFSRPVTAAAVCTYVCVAYHAPALRAYRPHQMGKLTIFQQGIIINRMQRVGRTE